MTRSLLYLLLPVVVVSGLGTVWAGVLNAGERFTLTAAIPIVTPTMTVLALLLLSGNWHVYSLAAGMLVGAILEAGILGWQLQCRGISVIPRWYGMNPALRQVIKQYAPMIIGGVLMSSTVLVDQSIAALLGPGNVAVLNYASRLVSFLTVVGALAIGTVALPYFSQMVGKGDWAGIKHTLNTYVKLILLITVPLTLLLVLFSEPIIHLVFERGAFTPSDTRIVAQVQTCYLLQVPFYLVGTLLARLVSSMSSNQILMLIMGINLIVNIALDLILVNLIGIAGIALSTALVRLAFTCMLSLVLWKALRRHSVESVVESLL